MKVGKIIIKRGGKTVLAAILTLIAVDLLIMIGCSIFVNGPDMWATIWGEAKASWKEWLVTYVTLDILFGVAFGCFAHGWLDKKLGAINWSKINKITNGLFMGGVVAGLNLVHFIGVVIIAKLGELLKVAQNTPEKLPGIFLFVIVTDLVLAGVGLVVYKFKVVDDPSATPPTP